MTDSSMPRVVTFDQVKYTGESAGEIPIHKMLTWMGKKWAASIAKRLGIEEELTLADVVAQHVNDVKAKLEPEEVSILARLITCFGLSFVGHPQYQMGTLMTNNDGWRKEEWMYAKEKFMEDLQFFSGSTHLCRQPEPTVVVPPPPSSTLPSAKTTVRPTSSSPPSTTTTEKSPVRVQHLGDSVESCFSPKLAAHMQDHGFRTLTDFPPKTQRELFQLFGGRAVGSIKEALNRHGMKLAEAEATKAPAKPANGVVHHAKHAAANHQLTGIFSPPLIAKIVAAGITAIEQFADYSEAQLHRMFNDDERIIHAVKFEIELHHVVLKPSTEQELLGAKNINKVFKWDVAQDLAKAGIHCVADVAAKTRAELVAILHSEQRTDSVIAKLNKLGHGLTPDNQSTEVTPETVTASTPSDEPQPVRHNGNGHNGNGTNREHASPDELGISILIPFHLVKPGAHILISIGSSGEVNHILDAQQHLPLPSAS